MTNEQFLLWEQSSIDTIDLKKIYIDIAGDLVTGVLLSQIIYWNLPSKETGHSKLRVRHEGFLWIAKGREDWWDECRISPKQFDRSINILEEKGLVITTLKKFDGTPKKHIRLILEILINNIISIFNKKSEGEMDFDQKVKSNDSKVNTYENIENPENPIFPKGQSPISPKVKMGITQKVKSITKNTTKNTTKNKNNNKTKSEKPKDVVVDAQVKILIGEFKSKFNADLNLARANDLIQLKGIDHVTDCIATYSNYIAGRTISNLGGDFYTFCKDGYTMPVSKNNVTHANFEQRDYEEDLFKKFSANIAE